MEGLKVSRELASRDVNDGFSGGERKRVEVLELATPNPGSRSSMRPTPASTSTRCASSRRRQHARRPGMGALLTTNYQRP